MYGTNLTTLIFPLGSPIKETDLFSPASKSWVTSVDLPTTLIFHQLISIDPPANTKHFLIAGKGIPGSNWITGDTYLYDWNNSGLGWQQKVQQSIIKPRFSRDLTVV